MVIEADFDMRTLANMNVALERVCGRMPGGGRHEVRKRVAEAIIRSARSGNRTLGALIEAGDKVLWRMSDNAATAGVA
jgi:hypothetical protein